LNKVIVKYRIMLRMQRGLLLFEFRIFVVNSIGFPASTKLTCINILMYGKTHAN